jgi:hypothetical protein
MILNNGTVDKDTAFQIEWDLNIVPQTKQLCVQQGQQVLFCRNYLLHPDRNPGGKKRKNHLNVLIKHIPFYQINLKENNMINMDMKVLNIISFYYHT